jgi:hypothetical protein
MRDKVSAPKNAREISQRAFLAAFARCGHIGKAATAAKVDRRSHYYWLNDDAEYAAAFLEAKEAALEILEKEAVRRAVQGLRRYKFHRGEPILDPKTKKPYYELEYSDVLLIFLLKALNPGKYRDKVVIEQNITQQMQVNQQLVSDTKTMDAVTALPPAVLYKLANQSSGKNGNGNGNENGIANGNGHE